MELVPFGVKHLRHIPGESLQLPVEIQDGKLDSLPCRVETNSKLRAPLCVGDPDQMPRVGPGSAVPECCHKAELLRQSLVEDSQCVHPQVGGRINPVGRLHFVGTTHPEHRVRSFFPGVISFTWQRRGIHQDLHQAQTSE